MVGTYLEPTMFGQNLAGPSIHIREIQYRKSNLWLSDNRYPKMKFKTFFSGVKNSNETYQLLKKSTID